MTGMFPSSGVPAAEAKNSLPNPNTINCDELWYSTSRCQPRFDPAAANAVLAELINIVECAGIEYDCDKLDNLCLAIKTMLQSVGNCSPLSDGPNDYTATLDPPLMAYPTDCCMLIKVTPNVNCLSPVRLNLNGLGFRDVLRNDGKAMMSNDLNAGIPTIMIFCNGKFYVPYPVKSQLPAIMNQQIDIWVRTDGNDTTGDGTANSPDKAFRTIRGAWMSVAKQYAASPIFPLVIHLGIPGTYEYAVIGPYGGPVQIIGDVIQKRQYRIASNPGDGTRVCVDAINVPMRVTGITCSMDAGSGGSYACLAQNGAILIMEDCEYELYDNNGAVMFYALAGASITLQGAHLARGIGAVRTCGVIIGTVAQALFWGGTGGAVNSLNVQNLNFSSYFVAADDLSAARFANLPLSSSGCTGLQYEASGNSVINRYGQTLPGSGGGSLTSGGVLI